MVGNPPQTFGRYHVEGVLGIGATGPVFRAEDHETHVRVAVKAFRTNLPPNITRQIVDEMNVVVDRLPPHPAVAALRAVGLKDHEPFLLTEFAPGAPLDQALKQFGPGAIADLLPRLQAIAEGLDLAAKQGLCHGALHPTDIIVSVDSTVITGIGVPAVLAKVGVGIPLHRPYTAPEVVKGEAPSNASDQFSLAAIAFEWLFGQPISRMDRWRMKLPALPEVDGNVLANAFKRALASSPSARFGSCRAFVDGVAASVHGAVKPALAQSRDITAIDEVPGAQAEVVTDRTFEKTVRVKLEPIAAVATASITSASPQPETTASLEPTHSAPVEQAVSFQVELAAGSKAAQIADPSVELETSAAVEPIADTKVEPAAAVTSLDAEISSPVEAIITPQPEAVTGIELELLSIHVDDASAEEVTISDDGSDADPQPIDTQQPSLFAETPVAAVSGAPTTPMAPIAIAPAPAPVAETPVASIPVDTPIPLTPPTLTAPSLPAEAPLASIPWVAMPTTTLRVIRKSPNSIVSALAADRGRGFALALAATLVLGIAIGFGSGYAAAKRSLATANEAAAATTSVDLNAQASTPEPVTSKQVGKVAANAKRLPPAPPSAAQQAPFASVPARSPAPNRSAAGGNGSMVIESQPPGAAVNVNGMARGKTPLIIGVLPSGTYSVTMTLPKFRPASMTVRVTPGERAKAAATLTPVNP